MPQYIVIIKQYNSLWPVSFEITDVITNIQKHQVAKIKEMKTELQCFFLIGIHFYTYVWIKRQKSHISNTL